MRDENGKSEKNRPGIGRVTLWGGERVRAGDVHPLVHTSVRNRGGRSNQLVQIGSLNINCTGKKSA